MAFYVADKNDCVVFFRRRHKRLFKIGGNSVINHYNRRAAVQMFLDTRLAELRHSKNRFRLFDSAKIKKFSDKCAGSSRKVGHIKENDIVNRAVNGNCNAGRNVAVRRKVEVAGIDFFSKRARKKKCFFERKSFDRARRKLHVFCRKYRQRFFGSRIFWIIAEQQKIVAALQQERQNAV